MSEPTLPEQIAAKIVKKINSGALKAGDRIVEQSIAEEFESSRGPVREAFKILDARNWIELTPRQGARVARHEGAPSVETILISGAMLGLAFRFAVQKATDEQIDEFFERARAVVALADKPGATADLFAAAARKAGNFAIAIANNRRINEFVGPVPQSALSNYAPLGLTTQGAMSEAAALWVELATAFKLRDHIKAETIGRQLVEAGLARILRHQLISGD